MSGDSNKSIKLSIEELEEYEQDGRPEAERTV